LNAIFGVWTGAVNREFRKGCRPVPRDFGARRS
jgi:hypothetical protein